MVRPRFVVDGMRTIGLVHPIERLRYVARAGPVPMVPLVREAAAALAFFADDPMGLLTSCRRLLDRRSDCGPLVWLAARMLAGFDPRQEAREAVGALDRDPTAWELQDALPCGAVLLAVGQGEAVEAAMHDRPDLRALSRQDPAAVAAADFIVLASDCLGPSQALVDAEAASVAQAARESGTPVWLVAGVGRILPRRMWDGLSSRHSLDDLALHRLAVLDLDRLVTKVVTPAGLRSPAEAVQQSDCPVVPELFSP